MILSMIEGVGIMLTRFTSDPNNQALSEDMLAEQHSMALEQAKVNASKDDVKKGWYNEDDEMEGMERAPVGLATLGYENDE